jgi:predicted transcriptional regulator
MEATILTTVTLSVAARADVTRRALAAFRGEPQSAHISFASVELLWRTLIRKRWELLRVMVGQGPMTIREAARRVGRDVKAVHSDVHALLDASLLGRAGGRRVVFPYDAVRVDFVLRAA